MKTDTISAQVSLYPLRQSHLAPAIAQWSKILDAAGLDVRPGAMSTVLVGDSSAVFDGLREAFRAAAAVGDVVMVVSFSNCCQVTPAGQCVP